MYNKIAQLEYKKEQLIEEIFIRTGDEDYITARWFFLNHLHRQFFWSAAQSLEKYLKASLILNGYPAKDYNHNIVDLFKEASGFAGSLIPQELEAPEQVKLFSEYAKLWGDPKTEKFVTRINELGNPSNRYDYFGIKLDASDIYKFDQIIFALRNITVKLDGIVDECDPAKTYADRIREYPNQQLRSFAPYLGEQDKAQRSIYESACENNFPFAPKSFVHQELPLTIRGSVPLIKIIFKNSKISIFCDLENWILKNFTISKKDLSRLKRK
ncbi:MAG: HEPN domain-containing protein [Proteobacteria bacterium]|nr:HEPN domain-containing protein [Pseudomonadota bacterium]